MKKKVEFMCSAFVGAECETIVVNYSVGIAGVPPESKAFSNRSEFIEWLNELMDNETK